MGRRSQTGVLNVILNGRLIGNLQRASSGTISFMYAEDWLAWEHAFPVSLSLPLRDQRYVGEPVRAVFENLLPDNDAVRARLAERVGAGATDAFSLLARIGRDCVGALQFIMDGAEIEPVGAVDGCEVSEGEIAGIIKNLRTAPLGVRIDDDRDFRISIAGAQEKTALLFTDGKWMEPFGTTPTTHILKPQIGKLGNDLDMSNIVENEHFCMRLCEALGLPTAKTEILDFEGVRVLSVERFDRSWTNDGRLLRLPQEDFCQALSIPPAIKYNADGGPGIVECLRLLQTSNRPDEDQRLFLKAQIVFWLMAATDGHAKNFSLFLEPGARFKMAPLYDIMSAQPNYDAGQIRRRQLKLAMAVGSRRTYPIFGIAPHHFGQSAKAASMSDEVAAHIFAEVAESLEEALEHTISAMPEGFPTGIAESIGTAMRERISAFEAQSGANDGQAKQRTHPQSR